MDYDEIMDLILTFDPAYVAHVDEVEEFDPILAMLLED